MNRVQQGKLAHAVREFETAVREHEMLGSQDPKDWAYVRRQLKLARLNLRQVVDNLITRGY